MSAHTKGPWRVEREADTKSTSFMVMAADDSEYASEGDQRIVASYLTRGDAELIARAPELLTACQQMCAALKAKHDEGGAFPKPIVDAWCAITEAVAAAGGSFDADNCARVGGVA